MDRKARLDRGGRTVMPPRHRAVLAVPANNTTMEREMNALCPELAPVAVARVRLPGETMRVEDLPAYSQRALDAVAPFLSPRPELVVHGCTAAGFLGGPEGTAQVTQALRERSGAAVVSTASAMVDALRRDRVEETAVVTPYLDAVNRGLRAYLGSAGIAVEILNSFECATTDDLGRVTEEQVFDLALKTVTPRSGGRGGRGPGRPARGHRAQGQRRDRGGRRQAGEQQRGRSHRHQGPRPGRPADDADPARRRGAHGRDHDPGQGRRRQGPAGRPPVDQDQAPVRHQHR